MIPLKVEQEILRLIEEGLSNRAIAYLLCLSRTTIQKVRSAKALRERGKAGGKRTRTSEG